MIVLDTTIVNIALPAIRGDLGFSETGLVWVVNAYTLTFSGCLLLGGRLGDFFGKRKLFLIGLVLFTLASVACGLARSPEALVVARAIQGIGGAVTDAIAFSLIINLFPEEGERAKAMGFFGFVMAGGGSVGLFLGGILTSLHWHWIFLINLPIGVLVAVLALRLLPNDSASAHHGRIDIAGAATITAALMVGVYAIIGGNEAGWTSFRTLGLASLAGALAITFFAIESRIRDPLVPLGMLRLRGLAVAGVIGILWSSAMFASFFLSALQLQEVLGYGPMDVGMAFLPTNLIMAAFSLGLSARIVMKFGMRWPLVVGMALVAAGLAWFGRLPEGATFAVDVLPGMLLLGLGAGMAFNPILLIAMSDTKPEDSGLASGIANTSFMMGGALGLAVLASLAAARTADLGAAGVAQVTALNTGYQAAFLLGATFCLVASGIAAFFAPDRSANAQATQAGH
jgi:EmrB/QacA subfamily drug resistance transporter